MKLLAYDIDTENVAIYFDSTYFQMLDCKIQHTKILDEEAVVFEMILKENTSKQQDFISFAIPKNDPEKLDRIFKIVQECFSQKID